MLSQQIKCQIVDFDKLEINKIFRLSIIEHSAISNLRNKIAAFNSELQQEYAKLDIHRTGLFHY